MSWQGGVIFFIQYVFATQNIHTQDKSLCILCIQTLTFSRIWFLHSTISYIKQEIILPQKAMKSLEAETYVKRKQKSEIMQIKRDLWRNQVSNHTGAIRRGVPKQTFPGAALLLGFQILGFFPQLYGLSILILLKIDFYE